MTDQNNKIPVLIVEDDQILLVTLKEFLERKGFEVFTSETLKRALEILDNQPINIILTDKNLPDGDGTSILNHIQEKQLQTKMILMTAYGSNNRIAQFVRDGIFDFLEKPFSLDKLLKRITNAHKMLLLEHSSDSLSFYLKTQYQIIGKSNRIQKVRKQISSAAKTSSSILVEGETGTGKELVARNIHIQSSRCHEKFISVNCAAIPENLFESEFFGYEKGAFTGANQSKPGYFELANNGTLHLDEIGEMPPGFQAKLLRVLEEGTYFKLGGTRDIRVNVRIIASTNKELKNEISQKRFREDLYYRIAVLTIQVPPLRERPEDIILIARHFWNDLIQDMGQKSRPPSFPVEKLSRYPWRGNVRELRNHIERIVMFSGEEDWDHSLACSPECIEENPTKIMPLDDHIQEYIIKVYKHFRYNKAQTARELGISLSTLKRYLKKWDIQINKNISVS